MSIRLSKDTTPAITAMALDHNAARATTVILDDLEIGIGDFCQLVEYVMTNTDLSGDDDPRLTLLTKLRHGHLVAGFNRGRARFEVRADQGGAS